MEGVIYTGTSGLLTPIPKRDFPFNFQDKSRLCFYASLFNSIEINSSFYKLPMPATISKWVTEVPANFRFTFKLWREVTHNKDLLFRPEDVERFMQVIDQAGTKKGCVLVQFPPSLQADAIYQFEHLLTTLHIYNLQQQWKVAVEFRHRSWYRQDVYDIIDQHNACLVIHDMPASASPLLSNNNDFVYIRFHGPGGTYRGSYSEEFLYEYAQYIREWHSEHKSVYVYFNNTAGSALNNLMTLSDHILFV